MLSERLSPGKINAGMSTPVLGEEVSPLLLQNGSQPEHLMRLHNPMALLVQLFLLVRILAIYPNIVSMIMKLTHIVIIILPLM